MLRVEIVCGILGVPAEKFLDMEDPEGTLSTESAKKGASEEPISSLYEYFEQ